MRGGLPRRHARRRGAALPLAAQERSLPGGAGPERNPADGRHGSGLRRRGARQTSRPRRGRADAPPPLGAPAHGGLGRHAAYPPGRTHTFAAKSSVWFRPLADEEIAYYLDACRPYDKAGSYGIQEWIGYAAIEKINGSFYNVMGLPIQKVYTELDKFLK